MPRPGPVPPAEFVSAILGVVAAELKLPAGAATGDLRPYDYSRARLAHREWRRAEDIARDRRN